MTLADKQAHRQRWLMNVRHIAAEITDLQTDISVAMQAHPSVVTMQLLAEGDLHCELATKELLDAASRIGRLP